MKHEMVENHKRNGTLADLIDRILDKGLIINADIAISICGTELLGIKIKAALSSFETAAKYGLDFPLGINKEGKAWKDALLLKESCPECEKISPKDELLSVGCHWCGWLSSKTKAGGLVVV